MRRSTTGAGRARQQGIALITAISVVAMAAVAATAMVHSLQLGIRRTSNILISDQGVLYTMGSEAWSRGMLIRDLQDGDHKSYDGLDEDWAKELPPTPVEGGQVQALTTDLQARFNLNNLYLKKEPSQQEQVDAARWLAIFRRLLAALELEESIAQAPADWLDEDIKPHFPDGAEDSLYLNNDQPYRTGNGRMGNPSELRLVQGVTAEVYEKLLPYVTALPETTPININTADPVVIRSLAPDLDEAAAEQLIEGREENPFKETNNFIETLKGLFEENKVKSEEVEPVISVTSRFYQLETVVRMEKDSQKLRSLIFKGDTGVVTLNRTFGIL
ncbi:MAG: type II secretion system minor pseudopilin GspK [Candidatus Thiodiazotropha sp.]